VGRNALPYLLPASSRRGVTCALGHNVRAQVRTTTPIIESNYSTMYDDEQRKRDAELAKEEADAYFRADGTSDDQNEGGDAGSSSPVAGCYSARWRPEPTQPGIYVADRGDWREPKAIEVLPEHLSGAYRLPEGCRWFGPIPDQARDVSDTELAEKAKQLKAEMARIAEDSEECGDHGAARQLRENARELERLERQLAA